MKAKDIPVCPDLGSLPLGASSWHSTLIRKKNYSTAFTQVSSLGILILVFKIDVKFGSVKFYDTRIVEKS